MSATYVLDLDQPPPPELAPNRVLRRGGHFAARQAEASYREYAAYSALAGNRIAFGGEVDVDILVTWPRSKRGRVPDADAHASMCKPLCDALADVGIIADDAQIRRISYQRTRGDVPGVRIVVTEAG